jgi:predicted RND superfamily exporter protein
VLPAITLSTIAIGIGFGVLGFSGFSLTRNLGLVTAVIMVVCFLADTTLLPGLLPGRRGSSPEQPSADPGSR